jgi:hypothetical protein
MKKLFRQITTTQAFEQVLIVNAKLFISISASPFFKGCPASGGVQT